MFQIFCRYFLILASIIFISKETMAITGKEISEKISEWLILEGSQGEPIFSKSIVFKDCNSDLQITKPFNNYKTINIHCLDKNGFNLYVRVKSKIKDNKTENKKKYFKTKFNKKSHFVTLKKKKNKVFSSIKLKSSLEKNKILELDDIELVYTSKSSQNSFFSNEKEIIGRKLKKNLKKGQLLHPRHLYEKFDIEIGDSLSIVSRIGNASVTVSGEAIDSGNLGELIKVKNLRSGNIIKGYVKKNKIIRVYR